MPETNLFAANVSATGVLPTPPLQAFCLRALKSRIGATPKIRLRWYDEKGFAISESQGVVVTTSWQTISTCVGTIPSGAVAAEVIQVYDGYVYYHTGANPSNTGNVSAAMDDDTEAPLSTLLMAGDILGQASYIRPMSSQIGRSAILARPINVIVGSNISAGPEPIVYDESGSAVVQVVPNRFNRLILDLGIQAYGDDTADVQADFSVSFRLTDYDLNSPYFGSPTRKGAWSQPVSLARVTVTKGQLIRQSYEYAAPNPGRYEVQLRLLLSAGVIEAEGTVSTFQLFHEVWA